eukprot:m.37570 g.37570  ORF g.37570 m.37570 type:complete len:246 (+) comp10144_c0_seq27:1666-2403(+)
MKEKNAKLADKERSSSKSADSEQGSSFMLKPTLPSRNVETEGGMDPKEQSNTDSDQTTNSNASTSPINKKEEKEKEKEKDVLHSSTYPQLNELLQELDARELSALTEISKRYVDIVRDVISTLELSSANIVISIENMKSISEKLYTQDLELKDIVHKKVNNSMSPARRPLSPGVAKETRSRVEMQREAQCLERIKLTLVIIHCYRVMIGVSFMTFDFSYRLLMKEWGIAWLHIHMFSRSSSLRKI